MIELTLDIREYAERLLARAPGVELPPQQEAELLQRLLREADRLAEAEERQGIMEDPFGYVQKQVRVVRERGSAAGAYSDFVYPLNVIRLYTANISEKKAQLEAAYGPIGEEAFETLFLLHEYFHFLELNRCGDFAKSFALPAKKPGKRPKALACASEIGANTFVHYLVKNPIEYIKEDNNG